MTKTKRESPGLREQKAPRYKAAGGRMRTPAKASRLEMRVTAAQKRLFERAAALSGMSLTDFAVASLQSAAERATDAYERTVVSTKYAAAVAEALLNPPSPNEKLRAAGSRYKALIKE